MATDLAAVAPETVADAAIPPRPLAAVSRGQFGCELQQERHPLATLRTGGVLRFLHPAWATTNAVQAFAPIRGGIILPIPARRKADDLNLCRLYGGGRGFYRV